MKQLNTKNRNILKNEMASVFSFRIKNLTTGMQDILLDDLVTAFESKLEILNRAQLGMKCLIEVGVKAEQ